MLWKAPQHTEAAWSSNMEAWGKRQLLNVVNNSGDTLATGTTIAVTVDTQSLANAHLVQSDCDDLRVLYQPTSTTWTEISRSLVYPGGLSCASSTATRIYFPLQADLASGGSATSYYIYYDNPQATTPTNTDNAFDVGSKDALLVCPFDGSTTCAAGETPSTETGAIRYSGGKSALSFDGANDSILTTSSNGGGLSGLSSFTVEFWINPVIDTTQYGRRILDIWDSTFITDVLNNGTVNTSVYINGVAKSVLTTSSLTTNTWKHVAIVYDGSALKTYISGVLGGTTNSVSGNVSTTSQPLYIATPRSDEVRGILDEVRISSLARYTSTFTPPTTPFVRDSATKLLYHFDENGDDPRQTGKAIDDSGNGNHGTITGAKYVAGLVGVDNGSTDTGIQQSGNYGSHGGVFIEEGTTNKVTNPSFEHGTYDTNWSGGNTATTFNFATTSATLTANMSKRNSAGPFAAGPMVQGKYDSTGTPDILSFDRGTNIKGNFYQNVDADQGTIAFWVTPEWSGSDNQYHQIIYESNLRVYKHSNNRLYAYASGYGGAISDLYVDISSSGLNWQPGNTYFVVFRWDGRTPIYNSRYGSLSVNNVHTFGGTIAPGSIPFSGPFYVGSNGTGQPGNAIVEGLSIYRRVLYGGADGYGIDVGNGDEIESLYNSGTGKNPSLVTGSWDTVFSLPTNGTTGTISTGTGEAWTHPHASNLLYTSSTNTGGFMLNGTYTTDGWAQEGTPSTVAALTNASKIFSGGYAVTSDAANEGIYRAFTATNGGDYVLRALGHSDGTCNPKILVTRADSTTEITSYIGTTTSTRETPNNYLFAFESPAAEDLRVKLINTATSGSCSWHQVEVLSNQVNNPSYEGAAADPFIPTGWNNAAMEGGDSSYDTGDKISGTGSFSYTADNPGCGWEGTHQTITGSANKFYSAGLWYKKVGTAPSNNRIGPIYNTSVPTYNDIGVIFSLSSTSWASLKGVWRAPSNISALLFTTGSQCSASFKADDAYHFQLTDVSLTVTPASAANSLESTGLRLDGNDTLTQSISGLTETAGTIRFKYTPRHKDAIANNFTDGTKPTILHFYSANPNNIQVYWEANNQLRVSLNSSAGGPFLGDWITNNDIIAGTTYDMELSYTASQMLLKVNGVTKITINQPINFATLPTTMRWGHTSNSVGQVDAVFGSAGVLTTTEHMSAPFYKFGSKSVKLVDATNAASYTTTIDPDSTAIHTLSAYVYDGTSGNVGGSVTSSIAKLVFGGTTVTPSSYTDMGGGWWRLSYSAATVDASLLYGVEVQAGKTIYVDGVQLEEKAYATTYTDGSLGTGYSWSGTAHASSSTRAASNAIYTSSSNISASAGTISMWIKPVVTGTSQFRGFLSTGNTGGPYNWLFYSQGGNLRMYSAACGF